MMRSRILLSICFLISFYSPSEATWNKQIYVSPSGNDSQSCGNRPDRPCKSLDVAFAIALNETGGASSTLISAAKGNYTLKKSFNLTNVDTFALVGEGSRVDEVRITCEPNVSLSFILCQNITLEGFMLHRCGGWRESTVGVNKSAHARQSHEGVKFIVEMHDSRISRYRLHQDSVLIYTMSEVLLTFLIACWQTTRRLLRTRV